MMKTPTGEMIFSTTTTDKFKKDKFENDPCASKKNSDSDNGDDEKIILTKHFEWLQ